jgi:nucleoid DNA-binding protein
MPTRNHGEYENSESSFQRQHIPCFFGAHGFGEGMTIQGTIRRIADTIGEYGMATTRKAKHVAPQIPLNSERMTKQQLIERVAAKTALKKSEAEVAVDSVLALIAEALRENERVDLRGFGSFVVEGRKERHGRNPRTGESITIAAKRDASFKPGKELTDKLAQGETVPPDEAV